MDIEKKVDNERIMTILERIKKRLSDHSVEDRDVRVEVVVSLTLLTPDELYNIEGEIIEILDKRRQAIESLLIPCDV